MLRKITQLVDFSISSLDKKTVVMTVSSHFIVHSFATSSEMKRLRKLYAAKASVKLIDVNRISPIEIQGSIARGNTDDSHKPTSLRL
jgi:hypothetical protein